MASGDDVDDEAYQKGLDALSSLISGRVRADGKNWSHAFDMMQVYLEVRTPREPHCPIRPLVKTAIRTLSSSVAASDHLQRLNLDSELSKLSVIHVAGTKGKGSTCAMIESILRKAGYKTGLYTSPHLIDVRERIRING